MRPHTFKWLQPILCVLCSARRNRHERYLFNSISKAFFTEGGLWYHCVVWTHKCIDLVEFHKLGWSPDILCCRRCWNI
jgi:hypothetical protein